MFGKFKAKWKIKSNLQLVVILIVFSVTGSAALIVRTFIFNLIGIQPETSLFIKVPLYILILIPVYQILLLIIGSLVGQYRFFFAFQKKTLSFLKLRNKNSNEEN